MIESRDIAWLAGILEGEGCFGHYGTKRRKPNPQITVSMADRDVIARVAFLFDCAIVTCLRKGGRQTQYRAQSYGPKAVGWMLTVYTLMGARRRAEIREILSKVLCRPELVDPTRQAR